MAGVDQDEQVLPTLPGGEFGDGAAGKEEEEGVVDGNCRLLGMYNGE